jgi:hypothetical protein
MWINGSDWERFADEYDLGPVSREVLKMTAEPGKPLWFEPPPSSWREQVCRFEEGEKR